MADNAITIVGTVTMDPELRKTGTGMSVLEVNFAGPKKRKFNRDTNQWENVEDDPQYFSGVAFGDLADNANATITKGMRVVIVGKLNYSSWQDQEGKLITWNHGSGTSDMVCQQRVRYNSSPSSTYYEIGHFYHGQNTTAFPFKLQSTSTATADLTVDGQIYNRNQSFVAYSTQNNDLQTSAKIDYTVSNSYANVFDNTNSRFTAQRAGLYYFYVRHWFIANQSGTVYLDMMKNGSSVKEFRVTHPTAAGEYETIQGTALIPMAVNDYMEVNGAAAGGAYLHESSGTRHSEFSGFYVSG